MHLRALRIRGFKSFRDPIELAFEPGVSVIVGPNGSGKSNVADALQWAMATQPPSQLRAAAREDILFAGSERHSAAGICEVELVLDNEDGGLPTSRGEVSIMRRLARDGDGDYLLNRANVRRMDVRDLLADAGLGRELHCIIAQGSVDQVLLARPSERRGLVEEAAGLGKFKRRRLRAQQKLVRVRADLERAADLEREIRSRLRPLEIQATAAERAEVLGRQVAESRLRLLASGLAETRRQRQATELTLEAARAEQTTAEMLAAEAAARREGAQGRLAALALEQEHASARAWAVRGAAERLVSRREALAQRAQDVSAEVARELERGARLREESVRSGAEADAAQALAAQFSAELTSLATTDDAELERADSVLREASDRTVAARRRVAELRGSTSHAAGLSERLNERIGVAESRTIELDATLATAGSSLATARARHSQAVPQAEAARAKLAVATADLERAHVDAESARKRATQARLDAARASEAAVAARARHSALEGAVSRADGVAPALRELARRGARLALAQVEVPEGLELATAAALERRAAGAIADDLSSALALLEGDGLDGASVLVWRPGGTTVKPSTGVALAGLVTDPLDLLSGVWLVDDAQAFAAVTSGIAVTHEGLGWDADRGVVFRVHGVGEVALLAARREVTAAATRADSAESEHETAASAVETVTARLTQGDGAERTARTALAHARQDASDAEREERDAEHALLRLEADESRSTRLLAELAAELQEHREGARSAAEQATSLSAEADAAERLAISADAERETAELRQRELAESAAKLSARRALLSERADGARRDAERASQSRASAADRGARADALAQALDGLTTGPAAALATLIDECITLAEHVQAPLRASTRAVEQETEALSAELRACAEQEAAIGGRLRDVAAKAGACELEIQHAEERLAEMKLRAAQLAETYELAVVDAVEPLPLEEAAALSARVERLERRRAELGAVNPLAKQEFEEQKERLDDVVAQTADLDQSIRELDRMVRGLTKEISQRFEETFTLVQAGFAETVETLFPGGRGRIVLTEPEPVDDSAAEQQETPEPGIELEIQPAGKRLASMALLSGGERSLGALAFLFALMLAKPSPFYVLDEVDAALDEANIARFVELVARYRDRAQFIVITHQQLTMEIADVLYGVSMAGDGVSTVLSRRLQAV